MEDDRTLPSRPMAELLNPDIPLDVSKVDLGMKFKVLSVLGRGGMGTVLKVRHVAMNRVRAVKLLHLEDTTRDPTIMERFRREATIASDLQHPNIVRIFDFDHTPSGDPYIAMEYIEGGDLQQLLAREHRLGVDRTIELLVGVADALDKVHALGIVHRDLKPANLFLSTDGTVKILDFGISHVEWDGAGITETGDILGTPIFMAPEQLTGTEIDHRTDIYALTAVAYELLTGRHAVQATNPGMLVAKILEGSRVPARDHVPDLPDHVSAALARGMASNPDDRFNSAVEFIDALSNGNLTCDDSSHAVLVNEPTVLHTGTATARPSSSMRRPLLIAALAVAVAGITAALLLMTREDDPVLSVSAPTIISWPMVVLPAHVDVPDVEVPWVSEATSLLLERYLSLDPRVDLVKGSEASVRLGDRWASSAADPSREFIAKVARATRARAIAFPSLFGSMGNLRLRLEIRDDGGAVLWEHEARGEYLDAVVDEITWAAKGEIMGGRPHGSLTEEEHAGCGIDDEEVCRMAIMAERAFLEYGFFTRVRRLTKILEKHPETLIWRSISMVFDCLEASDVKRCMKGAGLPEAPTSLTSPRARLWNALGNQVEEEEGNQAVFCALEKERDPLVSDIAAVFNLSNQCPGEKLVICNRTESFLRRYVCLVHSTMYDESETALRYYEEFGRLDLAPTLFTATFSMHPMRKSLDQADMWLQRTRLRTVESDPLLANSLVRIELARRDVREAMVWARRSINPVWREGQVRIVDGKILLGQRNLIEGTRKMLASDETPAEYTFHVILRPAIQPTVIMRSKMLAEEWLESDRNSEVKLSQQTSGVLDLAAAIARGIDPEYCAGIDKSASLAMEHLYVCEKWEELVALSEKRQEQGYAQRASIFLVADAHLHMGHLAEAERLFEKVDTDPINRSTLPASSILSLERLGRIAAGRGDVDEARERYTEFLEQWSNTDVELPDIERASYALEKIGPKPES